MQRERAAAALTLRHAHIAAFGAEHAHGRRVHVREKCALHAARDQTDARSRVAVFGGRERRRVAAQIGERERRQQRIELGETRRQPA